MRSNINKLLFIAGCFFMALTAHAQLMIVEGPAMGMTPLALVQNYLIGGGVVVSNVTFNGSADTILSRQIGYFNALGGAKDSLHMGAGIITTSGKASIAKGPNNSGSMGFGGNKPGDPDLTMMSGTTTKDAAVLEFDFIPQCDTVKFNYVFGSEEFDEYCNQYNDAFGFFMSGPGISGPFSNNSTNIAHMPNSPAFVTINNICNSTGFSWYNPTGGAFFQYDRLTHTFTAIAVVTPGATYHIKIAIADAVDDVYDSGVFLEKNSFTSSGMTAGHNNTTPGLGEAGIENCNDVYVTFHSSDTVSHPRVIRYSIAGTATNGIDYTFLPDSVIMPAGMDSVSINIHPLSDTLTEGTETVLINYQESSCKGGFGGIDTVLILDNTPLIVSLGPDIDLCPGDSATLNAAATGGQGQYMYYWNDPGISGQTGKVSPATGSHQYTVIVMDGCGKTRSDTIMVTVGSFPRLINDPLYSLACSGDSIVVPLASSMANTVFHWTAVNPSGMVSGYSADSGTVIRQLLTTTNIFRDSVLYTLSPRAGSCAGSDTVYTIFVRPVPLLQVQKGPDTVCNNQQVSALFASQVDQTVISWTSTASAQVSGNRSGSGTQVSDTLHNGGTGIGSVSYLVHLAADGCSGKDSVVNFYVAPTYARTVDTSICYGKSVFAGGVPRYGSGTWYDTLRPSKGCDTIVTTILDVYGPVVVSRDTSICPGQSVFAGGAWQTTGGTYYDTTGIAGECDTVIETKITIKENCLVFSVPTAFSPNGDGVNDVFRPVGKGIFQYSMEIYDRWGQLVFKSSDPALGWDGNVKGSPAPAGTYTYVIRYAQSEADGEAMKQNGSVTLVR